jgi:hypothetical protein
MREYRVFVVSDQLARRKCWPRLGLLVLRFGAWIAHMCIQEMKIDHGK